MFLSWVFSLGRGGTMGEQNREKSYDDPVANGKCQWAKPECCMIMIYRLAKGRDGQEFRPLLPCHH